MPIRATARTEFPTIRWGTQPEFTERYEEYLDTVYGADPANPSEDGRLLLAASIAEEIRKRGAKRVLDCAAGTGFPALDLAANPPFEDFLIHCTDSDRPMLEILEQRVRGYFGPNHRVTLNQLAPLLHCRLRNKSGIDRLLLDWTDLRRVGDYYDYVMCRGNSLVYASTWSGGDEVASLEHVKDLLRMITAKVRRGGYLHIDAPRHLLDRSERYSHSTSADGSTTIWEEVEAEAEHRRWRLSFKSKSDSQKDVAKFQRFSTLMTIDDLSPTLKELGFTETEPIELKHERSGFGVIIAKKSY